MARDLQLRLRSRLAVAVAAAAVAVFIASQGERVVVGWATRLARDGAPHERRAAIEKLGQCGDAGIPVLLAVAFDKTQVPLDFDPGQYSMLVPRDSAGDLALDVLRRLRMGRGSPRAFEWQGDYITALNEWRWQELATAFEWWETRRRGGDTDKASD